MGGRHGRGIKEALIKSTRADLHRKFLLTRKKSAEILCVFQAFLTKFSGDFRCEDARGDLFRGSLKQKGDIPTRFGETLSWEYLCWAREYPVRWNTPTEILYAGGDTLTSRAVIDDFAAKSGSVLTVMENGGHWFHTGEQLQVLREWERRCLTREGVFPVENSLSKLGRM